MLYSFIGILPFKFSRGGRIPNVFSRFPGRIGVVTPSDEVFPSFSSSVIAGILYFLNIVFFFAVDDNRRRGFLNLSGKGFGFGRSGAEERRMKDRMDFKLFRKI